MPSYTDRLAQLFPEAYAARERGSALFGVLGALGYELGQVDEAIKGLLKARWLRYASGPALDNLGALIDRPRLTLSDGTSEPDTLYRARLAAYLGSYMGGGSHAALRRALRLKLGLCPDEVLALVLSQAQLSAEQRQELLRDLDALVTIVDCPNDCALPARVRAEATAPPAQVELDLPTAADTPGAVRIEITLADAVRSVSIRARDRASGELLGGVAGSGRGGQPLAPRGWKLILRGDALGRDFTVEQETAPGKVYRLPGRFWPLDANKPGIPALPPRGCRWQIAAEGASFDFDSFDQAIFDPPRFEVALSWERRFNFEVLVPDRPDAVVRELEERFGLQGRLLVYDPPDKLEEELLAVVRATQAAGVVGRVRIAGEPVSLLELTPELHDTAGAISFRPVGELTLRLADEHELIDKKLPFEPAQGPQR